MSESERSNKRVCLDEEENLEKKVTMRTMVEEILSTVGKLDISGLLSKEFVEIDEKKVIVEQDLCVLYDVSAINQRSKETPTYQDILINMSSFCKSYSDALKSSFSSKESYFSKIFEQRIPFHLVVTNSTSSSKLIHLPTFIKFVVPLLREKNFLDHISPPELPDLSLNEVIEVNENFDKLNDYSSSSLSEAPVSHVCDNVLDKGLSRNASIDFENDSKRLMDFDLNRYPSKSRVSSHISKRKTILQKWLNIFGENSTKFLSLPLSFKVTISHPWFVGDRDSEVCFPVSEASSNTKSINFKEKGNVLMKSFLNRLKSMTRVADYEKERKDLNDSLKNWSYDIDGVSKEDLTLLLSAKPSYKKISVFVSNFFQENSDLFGLNQIGERQGGIVLKVDKMIKLSFCSNPLMLFELIRNTRRILVELEKRKKKWKEFYKNYEILKKEIYSEKRIFSVDYVTGTINVRLICDAHNDGVLLSNIGNVKRSDENECEQGSLSFIDASHNLAKNNYFMWFLFLFRLTKDRKDKLNEPWKRIHELNRKEFVFSSPNDVVRKELGIDFNIGLQNIKIIVSFFSGYCGDQKGALIDRNCASDCNSEDLLVMNTSQNFEDDLIGLLPTCSSEINESNRSTCHVGNLIDSPSTRLPSLNSVLSKYSNTQFIDKKKDSGFLSNSVSAFDNFCLKPPLLSREIVNSNDFSNISSSGFGSINSISINAQDGVSSVSSSGFGSISKNPQDGLFFKTTPFANVENSPPLNVDIFLNKFPQEVQNAILPKSRNQFDCSFSEIGLPTILPSSINPSVPNVISENIFKVSTKNIFVKETTCDQIIPRVQCSLENRHKPFYKCDSMKDAFTEKNVENVLAFEDMYFCSKNLDLLRRDCFRRDLDIPFLPSYPTCCKYHMCPFCDESTDFLHEDLSVMRVIWICLDEVISFLQRSGVLLAERQGENDKNSKSCHSHFLHAPCTKWNSFLG